MLNECLSRSILCSLLAPTVMLYFYLLGEQILRPLCCPPISATPCYIGPFPFNFTICGFNERINTSILWLYLVNCMLFRSKTIFSFEFWWAHNAIKEAKCNLAVWSCYRFISSPLFSIVNVNHSWWITKPNLTNRSNSYGLWINAILRFLRVFSLHVPLCSVYISFFNLNWFMVLQWKWKFL